MSSLPGVARSFGSRTGEAALRLGIDRSNLLASWNVFQGEFLVRGGTRVFLLGEVGQAQAASRLIQAVEVAGMTRVTMDSIRVGAAPTRAFGGELPGFTKPPQAALDRKAEEAFVREFGEPQPGNCPVLFAVPMKGQFRAQR